MVDFLAGKTYHLKAFQTRSETESKKDNIDLPSSMQINQKHGIFR